MMIQEFATPRKLSVSTMRYVRHANTANRAFSCIMNCEATGYMPSSDCDGEYQAMHRQFHPRQLYVFKRWDLGTSAGAVFKDRGPPESSSSAILKRRQRTSTEGILPLTGNHDIGAIFEPSVPNFSAKPGKEIP